MSRARLDVHRVYRWIFRFWRERRFGRFLKLIQPRRTDALVDVGGYPPDWTSRGPIVGSVDCVNVDPVDWRTESAPGFRVRALLADGRALPFPGRSYDIVYSNSVIEHVGSWDDQRRFARELLRVGDAIWVQTPAYECPIEPHYLMPFVHWLAPSLRRRMVRFSIRGLLERSSPAQLQAMVDTIRLLRRDEMEALFPGCEILTERLFVLFPKSYIAVRRRGALLSRAPAPLEPDRGVVERSSLEQGGDRREQAEGREGA
jgi:hypothetical protein